MNTLIKITGILVTGALMLVSCNQENSEELALQQQQKFARQDSLLNEYVQLLNDIDASLDEIRDNQGMIVLGPESNVDENVPKDEQIRRNISMIKFVLDAKQQKLVQLEESLSTSNQKVSSLRAITKAYEKKIKDSQKEIDVLQEQLVAAKTENQNLEKSGRELYQTNNLLKQEKTELQQEMIRQRNIINTAWYTCGTKKQLQENNILAKEGSLLSGKKYVLKGDLNRDKFTSVNIQETQVVPINAKKAKLITAHPSDSYRLVPTEKGTIQLEIIQPETFWSISKYLVIQTA